MEIGCTYDIETSGLDPTFGRVLCVSIKSWTSDEVTTFRQPKGRVGSNDYDVVRDSMIELEKYSQHVAHNGLFFDRAFLNGRALAWGLPLMTPDHKMIDPCLVARRHLNMKRNSLDAIATHLQLNEQKMHVDPSVWVRAGMDSDEDCMSIIVERCESDVRVLEMLFKQMLPLIKNVNGFGSA